MTGLKIPEGWVLVPKEATGPMLAAVHDACPQFHIHRPHSINEAMAPIKTAWAEAVKAATLCPGCGGDTEIDGVEEYCECKGTGRLDPPN